MKNNTSIGAIVLAAGKGSRMNSTTANKVTLSVAHKPLIQHVVERLQEVNINTIAVVVGFAKESVMQALGNSVIFAEQKEQLGTGHAALVGLQALPQEIQQIMVVYGDEFSYPREKTQELVDTHLTTGAALTFLTIERDNPFGLGRIVRDGSGALLKIVEEKDATDEEKKITEVNPGCYVCTREFLETYLPKIEKSPVTGEYYLTSIADLAIQHKEKVETVKAGNLVWRGVNTQEELEEAREVFGKIYV